MTPPPATSIRRLANKTKNEAQQPQDLHGTHHQKAQGDCALGSGLQFGHDQVQRICSLASAKHAFHLIAFALISKQLLLVLSIPLLVLGWPA